ncbi:MAG: ABC-2 family transporter protein [Acidobacteriia bacterium]|nr:ABC-2 family transporter protein [Terriglobia bacterium]
MKNWLQTYLEFARVGFVNILAYRLRYYTGVITYFINVTVYYFIWRAIFTNSDHIEGFNLKQMTTYVALGWIIRSFYFSTIDQDMANDVMEGKISMTLIKPIHVQWSLVAQSLGESCFRLFMLTAPAAVVIALVFPMSGPSSALHFAGFFASTVLSFFIVASINFIAGTCAIRLKSILGLLRAKYFLLELFSGLLIPMTFFPQSIQKVMNYLPFQHISFTPVLIYLGKIQGPKIWEELGIQLLWAVAIFLIGQWWWATSIRKLSIQGG